MAYSSIVKPSVYFNNVLWTGNGGTQSITGVGFQPDLVWVKERSSGSAHNLVDAVRGTGNRIGSNSTAAQETIAAIVSSFDSDGFGVGASNDVNETSQTYVAWNWKAGTGQGSSNTDGSINTTYTSVNTTAGFSISTYTGNGTNNATIGHGLGAVPKIMIFKILSSADDWTVYHASLGATKKLNLNNTDAESTVPEIFNSTAPTSSLVTFGTHSRTNSNNGNYIAYCFAEKKGYSKFGSYTGNGNANGAFIYTGFKPALTIIKNSSGTGPWYLFDNKRPGFNVINVEITANSSDAEASDISLDHLSNGFKLRKTGSGVNGSGNTYIYMAFAENPLVANSGTDGVPATAR